MIPLSKWLQLLSERLKNNGTVVSDSLLMFYAPTLHDPSGLYRENSSRAISSKNIDHAIQSLVFLLRSDIVNHHLGPGKDLRQRMNQVIITIGVVSSILKSPTFLILATPGTPFEPAASLRTPHLWTSAFLWEMMPLSPRNINNLYRFYVATFIFLECLLLNGHTRIWAGTREKATGIVSAVSNCFEDTVFMYRWYIYIQINLYFRVDPVVYDVVRAYLHILLYKCMVLS